MILCLFKVCLYLCVPVCLFRCYDHPMTTNVLWTYKGTPSPVLAWPSMTWAKWAIDHLVRPSNRQNGTYRWSHKHNWNKHAMNKYGVELAWHAQAYIKYAQCIPREVMHVAVVIHVSHMCAYVFYWSNIFTNTFDTHHSYRPLAGSIDILWAQIALVVKQERSCLWSKICERRQHQLVALKGFDVGAKVSTCGVLKENPWWSWRLETKTRFMKHMHVCMHRGHCCCRHCRCLRIVTHRLMRL